MLFNDDFIESLRNDPVPGIIKLCDKVSSALTQVHESWTRQDYSILLEAYALLVELLESGLLPIRVDHYEIDGSGDESECRDLYKWLMTVRSYCLVEESKLRVVALRNRFRGSLGAAFAYEFSQGDLDRVQALVNELRGLIASTDQFEKEHKQRLLRRLEKLQAEMHKKVSDLDRFWGLVGDAGVVVGKLGADAKPIVDRIREIAEIVWQTQSRAEELPSGTKLPQLEGRSSSGSGEV